MWLLCVVMSILLGYVITLWFRAKPQQFFLTLCSGWLVGYMINALGLFVTSYFCVLNFAHIATFLGCEALFIVIAFVSLEKRFGDTILKVDFEESIGFYVVLIISGFVGIFFLIDAYDKLPYIGPLQMFPVFDDEMSIVRSVLVGVNRRRQHFFQFSDPLRFNATCERSVAPLMFIAACEVLGSDYKHASIVVNFLNILATAALLYQIAAQCTTHRAVSVLCFLFFGGCASLFYFFVSDNADLVHRLSKSRVFPVYQVMYGLLMQSKSFSLSLALATLSLGHLQVSARGRRKLVFAGFVAALIPEVFVSLTVFAVASCFPACYTTFLPFAIANLLRISNLHVNFVPLWREWQMDGIFFSQIAIWLGSFGPLLLGFAHSQKYSHTHHIFLAKLATFVVLCFIRDGHDYRHNSLAIQSVWLPQLCISFVKNANKLVSSTRRSKLRGVMIFVCNFLILFAMSGGIISLFRSADTKCPYLSPELFPCAGKVLSRTHPQARVLCVGDVCRLPGYYGRQILIGNWRNLWALGLSIDAQMSHIKSLEFSRDPVNLMTELDFDYFIESRENPFIPINYSMSACFDEQTHDFCPIRVYKLIC